MYNLEVAHDHTFTVGDGQWWCIIHANQLIRREERTMNSGVTVLSSQEITLQELKDVLLKAGGVYHPDPGGGNFGVIMQGERCIWILTWIG